MQDGSCQYEQMPDTVHIFTFPAVKDDAKGVAKTAGNEQYRTQRRHILDHRYDGHHNAPAACDVTDHGENLEPLKTDGIKDDTQQSRRPDHRKDGPAPAALPQEYQRKGRVTARNEYKDGRMVKYSEDPFGTRMRDGVIQRGHGKKCDQTQAIDRSAHNLVGVPLQASHHNQNNAARQRDERTHAMGHSFMISSASV